MCLYFYFFLFFKQKPAYEMRISDWSSDVCSSDLGARTVDVDRREDALLGQGPRQTQLHVAGALELLEDHLVHLRAGLDQGGREIGRASCRERVCQYV